nr:MAG TPA: hypothetical protein [Caudoviricetes sp.]
MIPRKIPHLYLYKCGIFIPVHPFVTFPKSPNALILLAFEGF